MIARDVSWDSVSSILASSYSVTAAEAIEDRRLDESEASSGAFVAVGCVAATATLDLLEGGARALTSLDELLSRSRVAAAPGTIAAVDALAAGGGGSDNVGEVCPVNMAVEVAVTARFAALPDVAAAHRHVRAA